jgi:uroporphyrinogen decarboxylase
MVSPKNRSSFGDLTLNHTHLVPLSNRQPDFNQLRTALLCGQPNYVPALELFHDVEVKEAFLGRPIQTVADDIEFHYLAGYDCFSTWVTFSEITNEVSRVLNKQVTLNDSPYDNVRSRHWSPDHGGIITSMKDFEAFPWPEAGHGHLCIGGSHQERLSFDDAVKQISASLPEGMGLILMTDGIFERFTKDLMAYETFCFKLTDEPELIQNMFAKVGALWLEIYEKIASMPQVGALWLADDIAYGQGLLFSPQIMRKHLFPWYRRIGEAAARFDKPLLFHSDGNLRPVLEDLKNCGIKVLQPIEPKGMDIKALKQDYAGQFCLVGNIDLGSTLTLGTPDEVRSEVRQHIHDLAPGGGYCVGSSNSVTNYVPLANFKAMLEATFEFGNYPIQ